MSKPGVNEDPEQQLDSTLIKLAEDYASCDRRSHDINEDRKNIRDNVSKLGIDPLAWQHAVKMMKSMSEGERRDYQIGVNRVLKAISNRQNELFPIEAERIRKREEAKKPTGKEGAPDPDTNPKSDPKRGGAAKAAAAQQAKEQAEGAAVLATAPTNESLANGDAPPPAPDSKEWPDDAQTGKPLSQSEIAKAKLAAAGMN